MQFSALRNDGQFMEGINKSTVRILKVLSQFALSKRSYGLTDLSNELGITKNMAFRALTTLVGYGYLVRSSDRSRFTLGYRVLELSQGGFEEFDIHEICRTFMKEFYEVSDESVFLSVPVGKNLVTIDVMEGSGRSTRRLAWGVPTPLHAGPGARAMLAALSDEQIDNYIASSSPLRRYTPTTLTEPDELRREVALVRERGYALGYDDHIVGEENYISFAVRDGTGQPHAVISVAGPKTRFTDQRIRELVPAFKDIMARLNQQAADAPASPIHIEA